MSTCTRKVLFTLAEKGVEAKFVTVDIMKGEQKQPEHLARQPWGVIPAIDDGDFRLYESRAIIKYFADKYTDNGTQLYPKDLKQRAIIEQQLSVESSNVTPLIMKIVVQLMFNKFRGLPTDENVVNETTPQLAKALDIYEAQLKKTKFIAGDSFSVADIGNAPYFQYLSQTAKKHLIDERPHVAAWWKAVSERPTWQKIITPPPAPAAAQAGAPK